MALFGFRLKYEPSGPDSIEKHYFLVYGHLEPFESFLFDVMIFWSLFNDQTEKYKFYVTNIT